MEGVSKIDSPPNQNNNNNNKILICDRKNTGKISKMREEEKRKE